MIPVIFIHLNYSKYLDFTIKTAIDSGNYIYFITNIDIPIKHNNLDIININDLASEDNKQFSKLYNHLHSGLEAYELFCFQRWFFIKELLYRLNVDSALHIDSDVLLFADANKEWKKYDQYIMTLTHGCSGATSFVTKQGLHNFTQMLIKIYSEKSYHFNNLISKYQVMKKFEMQGGVCDMTLLGLFKDNHDLGGGYGRVGEMMQIIDNSTYDHNINASDSDYDTEHGTKKIQIIDNKICVYNNRLKRHIIFNALHCQGAAKIHIPTIYQALNEHSI